MISIIIPFFNGENYIDSCIESLKKQTSQNFEAIFINDGSKDNNSSFYQEKCNCFQYICLKKNKGVSEARNIGIKHSNYNYVCFMDIDDEISINFVEKIEEHIKKSNFDILSFNYYKRIKNNIICETYFKDKESSINPNKLIMDIFKDKFFSSVWRFCFKKDFIKNIKFDNRLSLCEDLLFILNALNKKGKFYSINDFLYTYNYNEYSTVNRYDTKMLTKQFTMHKIISKYVMDNHLDIFNSNQFRTWHLKMYRFILKNSSNKQYNSFKLDCIFLFKIINNDDIYKRDKRNVDFVINLLLRKKYYILYILFKLNELKKKWRFHL